MSDKTCTIFGAPIQIGAGQPGCLMGPDGFRTAGLMETIGSLGYDVNDLGNLSVDPLPLPAHPNKAIHHLEETVAWATALEPAAYEAAKTSDMPIFLGGDHSLSIGTIPGVARRRKEEGKELFVLWLDAHPDIHTLHTTVSGNLHGTPTAYYTGMTGFEGYYPPLKAAVNPKNVCMMGIRSVDEAENKFLDDNDIEVHDMRALDEHGVIKPLRAFLDRVKATDGALHVSLDVDFLEPNIAPAVGTTVPGGVTFREAHLVMEMLCESELVTSMDMVELNPFLDERGRTAYLMVDLCASLMGRKVLDRPTKSY